MLLEWPAVNTRRRKPDTAEAMARLIETVRRTIPLSLPEEAVCRDGCQACSLKLMQYLEMELEAWEARLAAGERPGLADLSRLERSARRIHRVLVRNGILPAQE